MKAKKKEQEQSSKKKKQNPLYVVKGDQVEQAESLFDMLLKKLNLEPLFDIINALIKVLFENIKTYAVFAAALELFDLFVDRIKLFKQFSLV